MWGDTVSRHGSAHMVTDGPYFTRMTRGGGHQEKKQHHKIRGRQKKKNKKERIDRTSHQGIVYTMTNTTVV